MKELLTVEELSKRLKVKPKYIYELTSQKAIPFYKIGRFVRFDPQEIDQWLECHKVNPWK